MITVSSSDGLQRTTKTVPSVLGKIMIEKGRLPTPTEIRRTAKRLDADLKKLGVKGDVVAGSGYSHPSLEGRRGERLQRLMSERRRLPLFEHAEAAGSFRALRLTNKASRAARDHLVRLLEEELQGMQPLNQTQERLRAALQGDIDALSSGSVSMARAEGLIRGAAPATWREGPGKDEMRVVIEAITIGLGLPSGRDRLVAEQKRQDDSMRSLLDRVHDGESVVDGEIEWSARRVGDRRIRRAAFGYCAAADRIAADYHQEAIFEFTDGSFAQTTVKRAHHDLEMYVDDVVDGREWQGKLLADAEDLTSRAEKKLRSWARAA